MPNTFKDHKIDKRALNDAIEHEAFDTISEMLANIDPVDIADLIESSPPSHRSTLWQLLDKQDEGEIVQHLSEDIRTEYLSALNPGEIAHIVEDLDNDDIADVLQELPLSVSQNVFESLDTQTRERLKRVLSYPEDSAGGLMNTDTITVRPNITLDVVFRYLRRHESIPEATDTILVVDRKDLLVGLLPISKLLVADPSESVRNTMITEFRAISASSPANDVADIFTRHDLVTAPVIDNKGILLGRITVDDVVDVIREEADHSMMSRAGLDEEDTFAPALKTSQRRAVWLGINLITAIAASLVIGIFQETLSKVIALAVLMPIVASMGGVAGNQTLTLVIRGIALGHIQPANAPWILLRELKVALLNGILWSAFMSLISIGWFGDFKIAFIMGIALLINLCVAAISGTCLPLLLRKMNIDPALAGGVIVTTLTDIFGFFVFLGLATLFYA